jgi:hypothetical protein
MENDSNSHSLESPTVKGKTSGPESRGSSQDSKEYLFDKPRNVKILFACYYSALGILLILDFFVHRHAHFQWEEWPEFYAVFGLVACVVLVLAAKYVLRPLVKRRENYYD